MTGTAGGGRGGLGIRGGAGAPRPLPFACLDLSVALLIAGLRMTVDACVDIERAGEDSRVPDSGDEERCSRWRDETVDEARSFEGTREAFEATGRSCVAILTMSCENEGAHEPYVVGGFWFWFDTSRRRCYGPNISTYASS